VSRRLMYPWHSHSHWVLQPLSCPHRDPGPMSRLPAGGATESVSENAPYPVNMKGSSQKRKRGLPWANMAQASEQSYGTARQRKFDVDESKRCLLTRYE